MKRGLRSRYGTRLGATRSKRSRNYRIGYNSRFANRSDVYRTTAMPYARLHNQSVPRSLAYSYMPEVNRMRFKQTFTFASTLTATNSSLTAPYLPVYLAVNIMALDIFSGGTNDKRPWQFRQLMHLYKSAVVDYATFRVSGTECGVAPDDQVGYTVATTVNNENLFGTGTTLTSAVISQADYNTYLLSADYSNAQISNGALSQVPGSRSTVLRQSSNKGTATHYHSFDAASWYKFPLSSAQQVTSIWGTTEPIDNSPTINYPSTTGDSPYFVWVYEPVNTGVSAKQRLRVISTITVEFHVAMSGLHLPQYAGGLD